MRARMLMFVFLHSAMTAVSHEWEWIGQLKNVGCVVKQFDDETFLLYNSTDDSKRYMPVNLPDELKKDGLQLCVTAQIGKIPPNVRLIGTPVRLQYVKVLKNGKKHFGLKKRKYKF